MKKSYQMIDLECAHCAAKMETAIKKLPGVTDASVNFITQKLTIEGEDGRFADLVQEAAKICRRIEPDCQVVIK